MTDESQITMTAKCPKCDVPVQYESDDGDAAIVRCPTCSEEFGTYGELKQMMVERAKDQLRDTLRHELKDHPWIKVQ